MYAYLAFCAARDWRKVLAIARHSFIETIRKKTLLVLVIFALVLIGSSRLFPAIKPEHRLRVIEWVCLWSITTIAMIAVMLSSAVAIPTDITDKTIYSVITKPVPRGAYVLGRVLGLGLLALLILVIMGAISICFVRLNADDPSQLIAKRFFYESRHYFVGGGLEVRDGRTWVFHEQGSPARWHIENIPELNEKQKVELVIRLRTIPAGGKKAVQVVVETENDRRTKRRFLRELPRQGEVSIQLEPDYLAGGGGLEVLISPVEKGDIIQPEKEGVFLLVDSKKRFTPSTCRRISATWAAWFFSSLPDLKPTEEIGVLVSVPIKSAKGADEISCIVTMRNALGDVWPGRASIYRGKVTEIKIPASFLADRDEMSVAVMPENPGDGFEVIPKGVRLEVRGEIVEADRTRCEGVGLSPKRFMTWLIHGPERKVVYEFEGLRASDFTGEEVRAVLQMHIGGGRKKLAMRLKAVNPDDPSLVCERELTINVKRVMETAAKPLEFSFDKRCISRGGSLRIEISRVDPMSRLGVPDEDSLRLCARPGSYYLNFAKALCIVFFRYFLIVAIAVFGSTFLSWPVSVLLAFFFFLCGYLIEFMRNASVFLAPPKALVLSGRYHEPWYYALFRKVVEDVLYFFSLILPDFRKFSVNDKIIDKIDIGMLDLLHSFAYMAFYVGIAVILGQMIFSRREIE